MKSPRRLPRPTLDSKQYWEACARHELQLQRCRSCASFRFYPSPVCPDCTGYEFDWVRIEGLGTVYSFTIVHRAPDDSFAKDVPYIVALVRLEQGPCMMSNIVGCSADAVYVGMPVRVAFRDAAPGVALPVFEPPDEGLHTQAA